MKSPQIVLQFCRQETVSPSVVSQDWGGIAFLESWYSHRADGFVPVDVPSSSWFFVDPVLSCRSSVLLEDDIVEGLDRYSLILGEACVVICADGHAAAGDIETTLTFVFYQKLQSMLLEGSAHSGQLAQCGTREQ